MRRFWQIKKLSEMSHAEWESLCDGCARCCLHKIEDEDSGEIFFTEVACKLLDIKTCRCMDYTNRCKRVEGCLDLRAGFTQFHWLPSTCAYRLLSEGKPLPDWHPLVSGDPGAVFKAKIAVRSFAIPENEAGEIEGHVIEWLV